MRSLDSRKNSLFVALTVVSASVVLTVACGGGANPSDAKSPGTGDTANASSGAHPPASSDVSSGGASGGATTTTALPPNGGELQGAKLGSSTHTEVETKGDAGPKAGPGHAQ
jgi:hypothetical protein